MQYRSISSHRGTMDPQTIDLAAKLGYNDVCFQVEGEQPVMWRELRDRWDRSNMVEQIKNHGMTISVWVHEFEDIEPEWGQLIPDNDRLWEELEKRYNWLLSEHLPEIDYMVLTVVESAIRVTDPEMLTKLSKLLFDICKKHGKQLIFRSFVWTLEEFEGVKAAIERLPQETIIMTKYVPQDWHRGVDLEGKVAHNHVIGQVGGRTQLVELDIAGEYFRGDNLAHCFADELHERFAYWKSQNVQGLSVRVDRGFHAYRHHHCILDEVQEANLWCLGQWMSGVTEDLEAPIKDWATQRFGAEVADAMTEIALMTSPVVAEALTVCGEPFADTRRLYPALRSMFEPYTIDNPETIENHRNPFCRWLAMWRWDLSLKPRYDALARGDEAMTERKKQDTEKALAIADEALKKLTAIKPQLDIGAYELLRFRLEENRYHLIQMGHGAQVWLRVLRLPHLTAEARQALEQEVETLLDTMLQLWRSVEHESGVVIWPEGRTRYMQRGTYLDIIGFVKNMRRYAGLPEVKTPQAPSRYKTSSG